MGFRNALYNLVMGTLILAILVTGATLMVAVALGLSMVVPHWLAISVAVLLPCVAYGLGWLLDRF